MLLAGDVGGTKTRLGLFKVSGARPPQVTSREYLTNDFSSLAAMIDDFRKAAGSTSAIDTACFGVAGPVIDPLNPFAPRPPQFAPRAKSVIFIYLVGGPSQVDTFDYKPALQQLNGKPVPASLRKAVEATRFANLFQS